MTAPVLMSCNGFSKCTCGRTFHGPYARKKGEEHLAANNSPRPSYADTDGSYTTAQEMADHASDEIAREGME